MSPFLCPGHREPDLEHNPSSLRLCTSDQVALCHQSAAMMATTTLYPVEQMDMPSPGEYEIGSGMGAQVRAHKERRAVGALVVAASSARRPGRTIACRQAHHDDPFLQ